KNQKISKYNQKEFLNLLHNIANREGTLAGEPFTRSRRARGEVDPTFDLLQRHNFSITPARFSSLSSADRSARSASPPRKNR
ncbi:hypothetical protein KI387_020162, partial [Taxus chinensis]